MTATEREATVNFDGISTAELEARFDDLDAKVNGMLDSLPAATWTPAYKLAKIELMSASTEYHAVGAELARRFAVECTAGNRAIRIASCGHPANDDGECSCAWWPERAPVTLPADADNG